MKKHMFHAGVLCRRVCHPSTAMPSILILHSTIRDLEYYRWGLNSASCMDARDSLDRVDIAGIRAADAQRWALSAE